MGSRLERECARIEPRARSLRVRDFRFSLEGDTVVLEGEALTPEGADSMVKLFESTSARAVQNRIRHAPPDPTQPGALSSPPGYVQVEDLGPNGGRLAETIIWEVRAGDNLEDIARTVYGDAAGADRIQRANRSILESTAGHMQVGMKLRLPPR